MPSYAAVVKVVFEYNWSRELVDFVERRTISAVSMWGQMADELLPSIVAPAAREDVAHSCNCMLSNATSQKRCPPAIRARLRQRRQAAAGCDLS